MDDMSNRWLGAAALTLSSLLWAGNAIVGRAVRLTFDPPTLSFYRWCVAAIVLGLIQRGKIATDLPIYKKHWKFLLACSVLGMALFHTLQYYALAEDSATDVSLIISFTPAVVAAISALLEAKMPHPREILGLALSVAGAIVVTTHGALGALEGGFSSRLLVISAMLCWAGYSLLARARPSGLSISSMIFAMACLASLCLSPFYVLSLLQGRVASLDVRQVLAILYVALFASIFAYRAYSIGIERIGVVVAPQYLGLAPVFTGVMSYLFLGEAPGLYDVAATIFILGGLFLSTAPASTPAIRFLFGEVKS